MQIKMPFQKCLSREAILAKTILVMPVVFSVACAKTAFTPVSATDTSSELINPGNDKIVDEFTINDEKPLMKVDILFVVDNSLSMADEQMKMAQRLSSFVNTLDRVDWQIGITTTDVSNGPFSQKGNLVDLVFLNSSSVGANPNKILTKNTANYEEVFLETVLKNGTPANCGLSSNAEDCPSGYEQPLRAISMALDKRNSVNAGFFRNDADLVTIVLSDEDEEPETGLATTPEDVINRIRSSFGNQKNFSNFGIIMQSNSQKCPSNEGSGSIPGIAVQKLADLSGGLTVDICEADYGPPLAKIGRKVRRVSKDLNLKFQPENGTVEVELTPAQPEITWSIKDSVIELSDTPSKGTKIKIKYQKK